MKNMIRLLAGLVLTITVFVSCKKEIENVAYLGGTNPNLTASNLAPVVLTKADENKVWNTFTWTNPDYKFSTGISSQDVTYTLQFDTTGSNFTNPNIQEIAVAKDLSKVIIIKDINTAMAKLGLTENMMHNMEIRLKSALVNSSVPLFSNVLKSIITNYLDVAVPLPATGTLWLTGDATASGYANPLGAPYDVNQKFSKVSNTLYELTVNMKGGGAYKLIQEQGVWGTQYHMLTGGAWDSGNFEQKDADPGFTGPPTAGTYKISFDFKIGKYTVTKL